jgi:hypothetical protein
MRSFITVAVLGILILGCGQLTDDEELNSDDLSSIEEAVVAGCSIVASTPYLAKCNSGDTVNSIIGKATVTCTTAQSSIYVATTLQKFSGNTVLGTWNRDFTCNKWNTSDGLNPKTCFVYACAPYSSGNYKTFGSSPQGGSTVSPTKTF